MPSKTSLPSFVREFAGSLESRLLEPRRYLQVIAGARQVGKTTLVRQVLAGVNRPHHFVSADEPTLRDAVWLRTQWDAARLIARDSGDSGAVLALDEIQKITGWSETVKRLWDEDTASALPLHVVLLGSAPLLVQDLHGRLLLTGYSLPRWAFRCASTLLSPHLPLHRVSR